MVVLNLNHRHIMHTLAWNSLDLATPACGERISGSETVVTYGDVNCPNCLARL